MEEHRRLRHRPSQMRLVEPLGETPYLVYEEDVSKTNQSGLFHRKCEGKEVMHYANLDNPQRCLVRLYKLYQLKCPTKRPDGAFYLKPVDKQGGDVWYTRQAIGHNTLLKTINRMCTAAGIEGHFTIHSLRTSAASHLFEAGIEKQLIMQRTGHHSVEGVIKIFM